jgi:hypothetical protein
VKVINHFTLAFRSVGIVNFFCEGNAPIDESLFERLMNQNVIWSYAGLSRVLELSRDNLVYGIGEVRTLINDSGALAAQLQNTRDKVLSSSLGHDSSNESGSSETNKVESLLV